MKVYKLGNSTITIVPPDISDEERQKRLKAIESCIFHLLKNRTSEDLFEQPTVIDKSKNIS